MASCGGTREDAEQQHRPTQRARARVSIALQLGLQPETTDPFRLPPKETGGQRCTMDMWFVWGILEQLRMEGLWTEGGRQKLMRILEQEIGQSYISKVEEVLDSLTALKGQEAVGLDAFIDSLMTWLKTWKDVRSVLPVTLVYLYIRDARIEVIDWGLVASQSGAATTDE